MEPIRVAVGFPRRGVEDLKETIIPFAVRGFRVHRRLTFSGLVSLSNRLVIYARCVSYTRLGIEVGAARASVGYTSPMID
jgi:hypothetical protein